MRVPSEGRLRLPRPHEVSWIDGEGCEKYTWIEGFVRGLLGREGPVVCLCAMVGVGGLEWTRDAIDKEGVPVITWECP